MRTLMLLVVLSLSGCATGSYGYSDPAAMNGATTIFSNWMAQDRPAARPVTCQQTYYKDAYGRTQVQNYCR